MEQILFVVLVGAVALLRLVMQAAEKKRNEQAVKRATPEPQANAPVQRAPSETEEERVRKFMEALGVPTSNAPLPRAPRRVVVPKTERPPRRKIMPVDPFPAPRGDVPARPIEFPPPVVLAPPTPPLVPTVVSMPPPVAITAPTFEVRDIRWGSEQAAQPSATSATAGVVSQAAVAPDQSWATRLTTAQGARDAIVLREIFGLPRSLQPFDLTATAP